MEQSDACLTGDQVDISRRFDQFPNKIEKKFFKQFLAVYAALGMLNSQIHRLTDSQIPSHLAQL